MHILYIYDIYTYVYILYLDPIDLFLGVDLSIL